MSKFFNWESRPAVMADDNSSAFVIPDKDEAWEEADPYEVGDSGVRISEAAFRSLFAPWLRASPVEPILDQLGSAASASRDAAE